jgi:hypothetical protein
MANDSPRDAVTIQTWIECGLRLGLTAHRTLTLARSEGYSVRTAAFNEQWKATQRRFVEAGIAVEGEAA